MLLRSLYEYRGYRISSSNKGRKYIPQWVFNIACTNIIGRIARDHNNVKSFNNKYTIVRTKSGNQYIPRWYIECDDNMEIILSGYATDDKCIATVMRNGEVCVKMAYQFANTITHGTEISAIHEELYDLILVLLHYDAVEELKDMRGPDNCIQAELTEQDLEKFPHENDFDGKSAEVIELR